MAKENLTNRSRVRPWPEWEEQSKAWPDRFLAKHSASKHLVPVAGTLLLLLATTCVVVFNWRTRRQGSNGQTPTRSSREDLPVGSRTDGSVGKGPLCRRFSVGDNALRSILRVFFSLAEMTSKSLQWFYHGARNRYWDRWASSALLNTRRSCVYLFTWRVFISPYLANMDLFVVVMRSWRT